MFQHGSSTNKRPRKLNYFMAGSERMLKAHHKNAVFHKSLEDKKNAFDADCHKKISKVQHAIYDVYFNEFVPLREEAVQIQQQLPNIHAFGNPRIKKLATIPGNGRRVATRLPSIYTRAIESSGSKENIVNEQNRTEDFLNQLRQQDLERQKDNLNDSRNVCKNTDAYRYDGLCNEISSLLWQDSDSDDNLQIDAKRMDILKTAIALTSQPPKPPTPRKPRRLRKSFLVTLRRQSKVVWEEDLLKRIGVPDTKTTDRKLHLPEKNDQMSTANVTNNELGTRDLSPKWRPSLANNKILNDSDDSDDEQYLDKIIQGCRENNYESDDHLLTCTSQNSNQSDNDGLSSVRGNSIRGDVRGDTPVHDMDNTYYTDSPSPDIYSLASEATGSYTSGYSYTTGSESDDDNRSEYGFSDDI